MIAVIKRIRLFIAVLVVLGLGVTFAAISVIRAATAGIPITPNLQSATAVSACAVQLSWDQSGESNSFQFNVNDSSYTVMPGDQVKPQVGGTGAKTFIHSELNPGKSYGYRVKACLSVGGCSSPSSQKTASTPALTAPPAPPTNIVVKEWQASGGRIVLQWTPAAGDPQTSGFRVYRSGDTDVFPAVSTFTLKQFTDAGNVWMDSVSTDQERRYRIKAYKTDQYCTAIDNNTPESSAWISLSSVSKTVIIPARPATVGIKESIEGGTKVKFEWSSVLHVTSYNLQVSQYSDFHDVTSPGGYNFSYGAGVTQTPDYIVLAPNKLFYYRVRAINSDGQGDIGSSDWRDSTFATTLVPPKDFSVMIMSSPSSGKVRLQFSWTDEATFERKIRIYDKLLPSGTPSLLIELGPTSCVGTPKVCTYLTTYSADAAFGAMHEYSVKFVNVSDGAESDPATFQLNLKVAQLLGWGWSGIADASGNKPFGLGWIRLSNNTVSTDAGATAVAKSVEANPYGVFVADDGTLSGYAWNPIGGWLSFNEKTGCPSGGDCTPRVDWVSGKVSGWAKFMVPEGGFDGWVSLRGSSYGLCIGALASGDTSGATCAGGSPFSSVQSGSAGLNGYAWGGSQVVGWINFSSAFVSTNAPVLLEASSTSPTQVRLKWNNPVEYKKVEILKSPDNQPSAPKENYRRVSNNAATSTGDHTEIVPNLTPNTSYGFFIRGYTQIGTD